MQAIRYRHYGDPTVLELTQDNPMPKVKAKDIRIQVMACEVTKGDCELRSFNFPVKWFVLPLRLFFGVTRPRPSRQILGGYVAGVVESVGSDVSRFNVGDRVFGSTGLTLGGYGEFVSVPESATLAKIPDTVTFEQAAALPLGALNAIHFMNLANLQAGQQVLINGAGGSIGLYAMQIARARGVSLTVIDAEHKLAFLRGQGAEEAWDYRTNPLEQTERQWDVIFNMVAGMPLSTFTPHLKPKGVFLTGNPTLRDIRQIRTLNRKTTQKGHYSLAKETNDELQQIAEAVSSGQLQAVIDSVLPPEQIIAAHQRVEAEQRLGAVVLSMAESNDTL